MFKELLSVVIQVERQGKYLTVLIKHNDMRTNGNGGVSDGFFICRTYTASPINATALSLTFLNTCFALRDQVITISCIILPVNMSQCCDNV